MSRIGWTKDPVDTANTNRDGSGVLVKVLEIAAGGQFVDTVACRSLGTNVATVAALIGTNGQGLENPRNNFLAGSDQALAATTLGTPASTDTVEFQVGTWFDEGYEIHALVHDNQAAGRQFIAHADPTYQRY